MGPRTWLFLVSGVGLLFAACGGDDGNSDGLPGAKDRTATAAGGGTSPSSGGKSGSVTVPDACTLITPEQIKTLFNVVVGPGGGSSPGAKAPQCAWLPVDFNPGFAGVDLAISPYDKTFFDLSKANAPDHKDVPGVGDAAYFQQTAGTPYRIWIHSGDLTYILGVVAVSGEPATMQQKTIELAKLMLAHK